MINPLKAYVGHPKALMALMHEDAFNYLFKADELEVIKECIPWTAVIEDKRIQRNGVTVKLKDYLVENKDNLVIKPDLGFGGNLIYIGNNMENDEWLQVVNHAIPISGKHRFVAQEMANIPKDKFPILEKNDYKGFEEYNVLINLWSFNGEFGGAHVRAAKTKIINVSLTSRGGMVPVFYIDN
jgi:hypothetical protein